MSNEVNISTGKLIMRRRDKQVSQASAEIPSESTLSGPSSVNPTEILVALLGIDGSGSGFDADLLDGLHASAFSLAGHIHDDRYYTETELNAGQLDTRYYTKTELNAGQLDTRYYTKTELNAGQLDTRYYTETEIDGFTVKLTGNQSIAGIKTFTDGVIITNATNAALTNSGGVVKNDYVSQTTGYRISASGEADFRYLFADQLHVKSFIADIEQALAGGQIIAKSVAKVATDFTIPAAGSAGTLVVEEFAGYTGAVFVNGDVIRLRQFSRANNTTLEVADVWGTVVYASRNGSANPTTQSFTFTRSSAPNAGSGSGTIKTGTLALDYGVTGQGYYETTAVDGVNGINSPYSQVVTWTGHPATGSVLKFRAGNLSGIYDAAFGGTLSGFGIYGDNAYLKGKMVIASGSSGYANISDKPTIPTNTNQLTDGAGLGTTAVWSGVSGTGKPADYANYTTNTNQLTDGANLGGTATWSGISSKPSRFADAPAGAGLCLTASFMGYYNGGAWTSYIDNTGACKFVGVTEFGTATAGYGGDYGGTSNVALKGADIWENAVNGQSSLYINRIGYNGGTTQWRALVLGDGKGGAHMRMWYNTNTQYYWGIECGSLKGQVGNEDYTDRRLRYYGTSWFYGGTYFGQNVDFGTYCNTTAVGTHTAANFILNSDERLKENIKPISTALPVNAQYKQFNLKSDPTQKRYGVIAQSLQKAHPELVRADSNGMLSVAYIDLLIKEVAYLKDKVAELEGRIG